MDANLIVIENSYAYIEDIERRLREMESWGVSWKNSSFYYDLLSQKANWIRRKNEAYLRLKKGQKA